MTSSRSRAGIRPLSSLPPNGSHRRNRPRWRTRVPKMFDAKPPGTPAPASSSRTSSSCSAGMSGSIRGWLGRRITARGYVRRGERAGWRRTLEGSSDDSSSRHPAAPLRRGRASGPGGRTLMAVTVRAFDPAADRSWATELLDGDLAGAVQARRGETLNALDLPGLVADDGGRGVGLLFYRF